MSSQPVTPTNDAESVSENAPENEAGNESITRVIARRLAVVATALDALAPGRLHKISAAIDELERLCAPEALRGDLAGEIVPGDG